MNLYSRYELPKLLVEHNIKHGIELGVGGGEFSFHLLTNYNFEEFYGVDSYADHHNVKEYKNCYRKLKAFTNHTLLRTTFDEALDFFEDNFLDFIFYDGYDYNINTLSRWFLKLKPNGIFSGRCYEKKWPRRGPKWPGISATSGNSVENTDLFIKQHALQLNIIEDTSPKDKRTKPSEKDPVARGWYTIKK